MQWRVGTMGFGYSEWAGVFYPPGVRQPEYLSYYSKCFDTVELDTTFYAAPDAARVRKWAESVPDQFRFTVKTPRDITHAENVGSGAKAMLEFLEALREFGPKLGCVLLQFPPVFDASRRKEFERLVQGIPTDFPMAVEFRHYSWWQAGWTPQLMADYDMTWTSVEYVGSPRELRITSDRAYVRLIGQHERFPDMNREEIDMSREILWWKEQLQAANVREAWIFCSNDYAGYAIGTAERLKRLVGQETPRPLGLEAGLFG